MIHARYIVLVLSIALLSGCGDSLRPKMFDGEVSSVRAGQSTSITLLDWNEAGVLLKELKLTDNWEEHKKVLMPKKSLVAFYFPDKSTRSLELTGAATAVVGAAIDYVREELKKEAARHSAQSSAVTYDSEFWEPGGKPKYAGFMYERRAKGFGAEKPTDPPALRIICLFDYSDHDPRLVILRPVLVEIRAARAAVWKNYNGERTIKLSFENQMTGAWMDKSKLVQQDLANASFTFSSIKLPAGKSSDPTRLDAVYKSSAKRYEGKLKDKYFGYFMAPQISTHSLNVLSKSYQALQQDRDRAEGKKMTLIKNQINNKIENKNAVLDELNDSLSSIDEKITNIDTDINNSLAGGAFKLLVRVTEEDAGWAKESILKAEKYLGDNRDKIIETVLKP